MQRRIVSRRAFTLAAAAAVAALIPAAVFTAGSSAAGSAGAAAAPACTTSQLVVWLQTNPGGGVAGGYYYNLEFTNLGTQACTLYGYPGVSAIGLSGGQLGSPAGRNAAHAARVVTLASGAGPSQANATATAVLKVVDTGVYGPSQCRQKTAAGLRVYPPGQRGSKTVPLPFEACSASGPVFLQVDAVQR
jgi:hypothetical protein